MLSSNVLPILIPCPASSTAGPSHANCSAFSPWPNGTKAALVFADLDGLKKINDAKGHLAGDAALARVARTILANTRRTDTIGRLGGDEFGVILAESDVAAARKKAAALADLAAADPVGEADGWRGAPFTARVSCGVVEIRKGASVEETLSLADSAMYRVKKAR